jgi:hypothetical protein
MPELELAARLLEHPIPERMRSAGPLGMGIKRAGLKRPRVL